MRGRRSRHCAYRWSWPGRHQPLHHRFSHKFCLSPKDRLDDNSDATGRGGTQDVPFQDSSHSMAMERRAMTFFIDFKLRSLLLIFVEICRTSIRPGRYLRRLILLVHSYQLVVRSHFANILGNFH